MANQNDEMLYAPTEVVNASEGFTETLVSVKGEAHAEAYKAAIRGNRHLKTEGGKGQEGIELIDGSVLTVRETAALTIARDVIDDALRHHAGKTLKDLTLVEIARFANGRTKNRACTDSQVLAEIVRLQNHEIYGGRVARR